MLKLFIFIGMFKLFIFICSENQSDTSRAQRRRSNQKQSFDYKNVFHPNPFSGPPPRTGPPANNRGHRGHQQGPRSHNTGISGFRGGRGGGYRQPSPWISYGDQSSWNPPRQAYNPPSPNPRPMLVDNRLVHNQEQQLGFAHSNNDMKSPPPSAVQPTNTPTDFSVPPPPHGFQPNSNQTQFTNPYYSQYMNGNGQMPNQFGTGQYGYPNGNMNNASMYGQTIPYGNNISNQPPYGRGAGGNNHVFGGRPQFFHPPT